MEYENEVFSYSRYFWDYCNHSRKYGTVKQMSPIYDAYYSERSTAIACNLTHSGSEISFLQFEHCGPFYYPFGSTHSL